MDIKNILIKRDNMASSEADELISDAQDAMNEYLESGDFESAENVCAEYFGLEPDYLFDILV